MSFEQDHNNTMPVPTVPTLRVSWSQDRCWHGDTVKIHVRAWFVPDGTRVDLSINPTGVAAIATIPNLQINAGVLDHDYLVDWSTLVIAASFYLAVVPLINGDVLRRLSLAMGDGLGALLLTSLLLCFVPVMLLGMFSPCSVFLVAAWGRPEQEGVIAGRLYGVSTLGSVAGTLGVTFALIPRMGSANLTLLLAGIAFLAGTSLWVMGRGERKAL